MERGAIDVGIDLGTTNSTIAVMDGIDAKVIPNKVGSTVTPSAVWIDQRGHLRIGEEAKLRALGSDEANAVAEFKLLMGSGEVGRKQFSRSGKSMLPEELSAEVLKALKIDFQTNTGEDLPAAVITVPAGFENPQTNATQKAAKLAGFVSSPLLLEPVAAALAYGFQSESDNVYWFVYDFGGGTFDAAVMRIRDGLIQVVNHNGNNHLGGKLIDWGIVTKKLVPILKAEYNLPDFKKGNRRWNLPFGMLKYYAEKAKIEVCRTKAASEIWVEDLGTDAEGKKISITYELTPQDVEETSRPHMERSLEICRKTLEECGLSGFDMDRVLMVGGTTLSPWVRETVQEELGGKVEFGLDPVTVVARGAAIFAGTQKRPATSRPQATMGAWIVDVEHQPIGNVPDPDIGGRIIPPEGQQVEGCTVEFADIKTQWRSGRATLGADGVFMTQLFAGKQCRHEYEIEFCDASGSRIPTTPSRVSYTIGVIPEPHPPAAMSIGVGLASQGVAFYVKKGTPLPARKSIDHYTTVPLRAGHAEDELRIPLLEGEHSRAIRNHRIGVMVIRGTDVRRDLPLGSQLDITLIMDTSQLIKAQAYIGSLDQDFQIELDPRAGHSTLEEIRTDREAQRIRLSEIQEKAVHTDAVKAEVALARIQSQQLEGQIDELVDAAESDHEALLELDRRLRELAAAIDEAEDSVEWPVLLEQAKESRRDAERVVEEFGESTDRPPLASLREELERAIDIGDPDLLRRSQSDLDALYFRVLDRRPDYHVGRFEWLLDRLGSMRDPAQAEQIIAQGRRAREQGDLAAMKAANRQLISLLPREVQEEARHANVGGTITQD